ncbi:MAG TPA: hypothetical protein PLY51_10530 [Microthrixaceae bacterium]|nr:hypothetical protein [Microthrixaceae bacterium]
MRRDGLVRCPRPADLAAQLLELTFDPPWTPDRMSDAARAKFGW